MNNGELTVYLTLNDGQFSARMANHEGEMKQFASKTERHTDDAGSSWKKFGAVAGGVIAALGVAKLGDLVADGFKASVASAGDFESSLSKLKQSSNATGKEMELMSSLARQLGQDNQLAGVTASGAAQTMVELSKAGLSVNDTLAASKGVMSLAKAGQLEFADAAIIAASALNAFGLQGKDATKVADMLAAGANASQADLSDLAQGMQQSATVAKQFGLGLNESITALALFANNGIKGSDAGTSLKTMLIALAKPSSDAAGLMKKIGFNAYDAQGQFVGLREMSDRLKKSVAGLTDEQKQNTLATIFGTDAFRAAAVLADNAGASFDAMSTNVGKVGAAQEAAAAQMGAYEKATEGFKNMLSELALSAGGLVLPVLTDMTNYLSKNIPGAVNTLAGSLSDAANRISTFSSDVIKLLSEGEYAKAGEKVGERLATGIQKTISGISLGIDSFKKMFGQIDFVEVGSFIVTKIIPGIAIGLIAGLGNLDIIEDILKPLGENIVPVLLGLLGVALAPAKLLAPIGKIISKIPFAEAILKPIANGLRGLMEPIRAAFASLFNSGISAGKGIFFGIFLFVKSVLDNVIGYVTGFGPNFFSTISLAFKGGIDDVANMIRGLPMIIKSVFDNIIGSIKTTFEPLTSFISGIVRAIADTVNAWKATISLYFRALVSDIGAFFSPIVGFFRNIFTQAKDNIMSVFSGIGGWFKDMAGNLMGAGQEMVNGLVRGISNGKNAVVDKVKEIAKGSLDAIKKFFGIHSPSRVMDQEVGQMLMRGLAGGIETAASQVYKAMDNVNTNLLSGLSTELSTNVGVNYVRSNSGDMLSADDIWSTASSGGSSAPVVQQVNHINSEVDMDVVNDSLMRAMRRAR